jgi:membrane protein DedA with SNARE-associated domain
VDYLSLGAWAPALYPLIMMAVALDAAMPPIPSEIMVVTSGALCVSDAVLLPLALLAASSGSLLGDLLVYSLFKRRLTHLLDRFGWGRKVHRGIRRAADKGGRSSTAAAMLAGRFIPAGRTATMAAAGIAEVPAIRVVRASAVGSVLWACWMVGLGYVTGRSTRLPLWANSLIGVALGVGAGLLMAAIIALRRRSAARKARG